LLGVVDPLVSGRMVHLKEVQDEPAREASTSDAHVAEQIEEPMAREAP
jgi:hypothetical protein